MRKYLPLIFVLLFMRSSFAQTNWYHYNWDASTPDDFKGLADSVYTFDLQKYKGNLYIGQYSEVASAGYAEAINSDVLHGEFYKTFSGYESYLKRVLVTVIKDPAIVNQTRIFMYRDGDMNASMNESGILRMYVGMMARVNTEAELAMVMAHEAGHFTDEDVVKKTGRYITMNSAGPSLLGFLEYGNVFTSFWFSREDESAADFAAIKYMKASPYSLKGGTELFKKFKRLEIRNAIINGPKYTYISTHPDPGDRLKLVKFLSTDSVNVGKKNFVVDSVAFMKLKELCYQEVINIGLQENNLNDLITMCFSRYLLEPDNTYNLAVLIECLRRQLILEKKDHIEDKSFILNRYQTEYVDKSENYAFLNEKTPSILNYLTKGFIDITKEDTLRIKAKDLADRSVTEFTTYGEAYAYFKAKAAAVNCQVCNHYKYFESTPDYNTVDAFVSKNDLFATNDYLKQKSDFSALQGDMVVVLPVGLERVFGGLGRISLEEKRKFYQQVTDSIRVRSGKTTYRYAELKYEDQHLLAAMLNLIDMPKPESPMEKKNNNWMETSPELYSFFKRNNIHNLYVIDLDVYKNSGARQNEVYMFYKFSLPDKMKFNCWASYEKEAPKELEYEKNEAESIARFYKKFSVFYKVAK